MMIANIVSNNRGILSDEIKEKVGNLCCKVTNVEIAPKYLALEPFIMAMKNDKKRSGEKLAGVLMDSDFMLHKVQDIEISELESALNETYKYFVQKGICERIVSL